MPRRRLIWTLVLLMAISISLHADDRNALDAVSVPGIDPISARPVSMTSAQVEDFFVHEKKGMPVELTFNTGNVIKGLFSSYDDYYETVWIVPRRTEKSVFSQKGYKLTGIRNAVPWDVRAENALTGFASYTSSNAESDTETR